jgi:hypothetical protein
MWKTLSMVVLSLTFALLTAMAAAQDATSCTNATLHGSFGLRATGNNTASGPSVAGGAVIEVHGHRRAEPRQQWRKSHKSRKCRVPCADRPTKPQW